MQPWKKKKGFRRAVHYQCTLEPIEREILGNLVATVSEALMARARSAPKDELAELTGMNPGHKEPPQDPSLARLLPDFEREGDEEFDGDNALLRSLHEQDITRAKLEQLQVVGQALGPDGSVHVSITEDEAQAWVAALNDVRLYLAAADVVADAAAYERETLIEWLAYNQETLLEALMGDS